MPETNRPSRGNVQLLSDDTIKLVVNKGADVAVTVAADKSVALAGNATVAGTLGLTGAVTGLKTAIISDTNGNEGIKITASANAVNEVTFINAATGGAVQVAATGDDTNINLQLVAKGTTGNILIGGYGGVEATAGAATGVAQRGYVTTEALTTAAGAAYVLTLTNPHVTLNSWVVATVENGTNTQGIPVVGRTKATAAGTATIEIRNLHASQAFNGTLLISYGLL